MIYFAYGSNINPGQMFDRSPGHRTMGVVRLPDYRLCFPRFSPVRLCATAGIEAQKGETVWGVLYSVAEDDIPILHYHEGFDPLGPGDANRHVLKEVTVVMPGVGTHAAMTYFAVPDGTKERPSRDYLDTILDGARYHNLPRAWLFYLENIVTAP